MAFAGLCRHALLELSFTARSKDRARRALGTLASFMTVHVPAGGGASLTIDLAPVPGRADSGQLDDDLATVLTDLGETAADADRGLITVDEIRYLPRDSWQP